MAAVGGMLASAVIKVVIGQISSTIAGEIKLHKNMRKDLEKMKMTLESVEAVLSDAERRSITDNSALLWLKRLKDAMNDISDMLEDFEADTDLLAATMKKIKMPHKMIQMQKRLEKITDDRNNYRVLPEIHREEQLVPDIRETAGNVDEAEIIGRTTEKLKVLACLSGSTTQGTTIFPIWGFGGIGKTTLARAIFNDSQFKEYSRVWVYVSQTFDLKKIGNIIISQLSQQSQISDLHSIHTRLRELFTGKKILIILDDLWEKQRPQLEQLKSMLKQGEGSKVMVVVTTREESIAEEIGTVVQYELPPFTDEMCWDIIKQKCNFEACPDKERLEPIGKEIARKCGGVALAAQSLGHMLKFIPYEIWDSVRINHIWELSISKDTPNTHEVLASLLLSYNFMPPGLKLCFAYCGIFPKGHNMIKHDLIHQWIALGFIEPSSTFSTWQLGQSYVKQLLEMSFLQHSKADCITFEDVTRFTMHDLVHDLARSVMADEFDMESPNCRYAWRTQTDRKKPLNPSTTSPAKLRALHIVDDAHTRIQVHRDADSPAKYIHVLDLHAGYGHELSDSIGQMKQLRYLNAPLIRGRMNPNCIGMLSKLTFLNLRKCNLSTLPKSIGEMKGLMHLDLSYCGNLKKLPLSFGKLRELLYLDLSGCKVLLGIPQALGGLTKLQHLNLGQCENLRGLPEVICMLIELCYLNLSWCMHHIFDSSSTDQAESFIHCICMLPNMKELDLSWQDEYPLRIPESASRLRKLHLKECNGVTKIPKCVAKMDSQCLFGLLPEFSVYSDDTESKSNLDLLEHTNPENLSITMLENVKFLEEANIINLREKQTIGELTLEWTQDGERYVEDMELLRELVPPTTLQSFHIYGYDSVSFPDWLMNIRNYLPNLVSIWLCDLPNCNSVPPLGHLPNLQRLVLKRNNLKEWNTASSSGEDNVNEPMFPKLEEVNICDCPKLRIKPRLPRAASWWITRSDTVLISWGESVWHPGASSSSPVSTKLEVACSDLPLHLWSLLHHLPALSDLKISGCNDLASLPEITRALHSLKSLKLDMGHSDHAELGEWFTVLTSLQQLALLRYNKLEELPGNMRQLTQLQSLSLYGCQSMTSLPEWLGELTSLTKLEILWCFAIKTLPESIQQLTNLQQLEILGCPELCKWCAAEENKAKLAHIKQMLIKNDEYEATPAEPQHCGCLRFMGFK